jgi:predicted oxidoreductase
VPDDLCAIADSESSPSGLQAVFETLPDRRTPSVDIAVNARLRVIDVRGNPVQGLYAAGEALGHSQTAGKAYVGGMSVTPALWFGRTPGQTLPLGAGR